MKKAYASPRITIDQFAPNEYVAACAQSQGIGFVICDGSSHSNKTESHGFIIDAEDAWLIARYNEDRENQFRIYYCSVPGCPEGEQDDSALDLDGDSIWKDEDAKDPDGYKWYNITFKDVWKNKEARFTVDYGSGGGLNYTAS